MIKNIATITLLFSFAIYSEYFGITSFLFNTIVGILAIYYLFILDKKTLSHSGFFIGIAWFHWISISFIYYGFWYLIPIGIISIGFVYGLLFYILGFFQNIFYRLFTIYAISFIDPFGFNWFKINLLFVNSYIHSSHILIILVFLFLFLKNHQKVIPFFLLPFILYTPKNHIELKNNNIELVTTNIPQDQKWKQHSVKISFFRIKPILEKAIKNNKKIIIFPESSIEGYLNQQPHIIQYLKEKKS
jgi:apolipoprotein N-acyltransferase